MTTPLVLVNNRAQLLPHEMEAEREERWPSESYAIARREKRMKAFDWDFAAYLIREYSGVISPTIEYQRIKDGKLQMFTVSLVEKEVEAS